MGKNMNRYRRESCRAPWWDYGEIGHYFITINTKSRCPFFGRIDHGEMVLSEIGQVAYQEWQRTPEVRPSMNLTLGEFIVMPDHFHAIISIGETSMHTMNHPLCWRENMKDDDLLISKAYNQNKCFGPQRSNLSSIIRGFKSAVTTKAKKMGVSHFGWQNLFYDRIIRNRNEFEAISRYIQNNPKKWKK